MRPSAATPRHAAALAFTLAALVSWLGLLALTAFRPAPVVSPRISALIDLCAAGLFLLLALAAFAEWVRCQLPARWLAILFLSGAALDFAINRWGASNGGAVWLLNLSLLAWAYAAGDALGRKVRHFGHAGAIVGVMAAVDLWSVFAPGGWTGGQIEKLMAGEPNLLGYFIIQVPLPASLQIAPVLGAADLLFAAFFMTLSRQFERPVGAALAAVFNGIILTMLLAWTTGMSLPALPLMGLAYVVIEPDALRLPREDRKPVMTFGVVLVIALGLVTWLKG